jgi:hypothetical protein
MHRLLPILSLAAVALAAPAIAQVSDTASIPQEKQVLVCRHIETMGPLKTDSELNCYADGKFTLDQLYAAGWRVTHHAVTTKTSIYHNLILERR